MTTRVFCVVLAALGLSRSAPAQPLAVDAPHTRREPQAMTAWPLPLSPGQWCDTQQHYLADLAAAGSNPMDAACAWNGPCDDPVARDAAIPAPGTPIKTVRLSIHVFCENNGGNCAATQADVDAAVARLNADYAPWAIQFIAQSNFVNSTRYRYLDPSEEAAMKLACADAPAAKLNIYVLDSGGTSHGTFPWDPSALGVQGGIVMDQTYFGAASALPTILTHEVGHCLGLWHTFHGVDEVPQCGDCYEPAGRPSAQGDITGDWCSDTNPTPANTNNCFDPPGTDACSGLPWLATPYLNYMGYAHTCPDEFTAQQAGRMHCWTANVLSGWLQAPVPPAAPGAPTLIKLSGGQVRVSWADNSLNEDGFRVQRETKVGGTWANTQIIATVGTNTTSATDTPGAGTFHYRVRAFNSIGDSPWSAWTQIKN